MKLGAVCVTAAVHVIVRVIMDARNLARVRVLISVCGTYAVGVRINVTSCWLVTMDVAMEIAMGTEIEEIAMGTEIEFDVEAGRTNQRRNDWNDRVCGRVCVGVKVRWTNHISMGIAVSNLRLGRS